MEKVRVQGGTLRTQAGSLGQENGHPKGVGAGAADPGAKNLDWREGGNGRWTDEGRFDREGEVAKRAEPEILQGLPIPRSTYTKGVGPTKRKGLQVFRREEGGYGTD